MKQLTGLDRLRRDVATGQLETFEHYLDNADEAEQLVIAQEFATALEAPPELERVDDYILRRRLGRGAFGTVYAAEHEPSGHVVAVKLLHAHYATSEEARRRFAREIDAAGRVHHANLCRVLHGSLNHRTPYLVMDYVPGPSLGMMLREARAAGLEILPLGSRGDSVQATTRAILTMVAQLADALHALHSNGLLHRDIKPSNVLLAPDGRPILTDLGLVGLLDDDVQSSRSAGIGTPAYMAPEVLAGQPSDPRSDVWSLGVLLFECLTTRRPFEAATRAALGEAIARKPVPAIHTDRVHPDPASIDPDALATVIDTALAKDPAHRYETADALENDLRRILGGRPPQAKRAGIATRFLRGIRQHKALVSIAALGLFGLFAAIAAIQQGRVAHAQRKTADLLDRVFAMSRTAIDEMVSRTAALGRSGVRAEERRGFLVAVVGQLSAIRDAGYEDPELLRLLARASLEVGALQTTLGRPADGRTALENAVSALRSLVATAPTPKRLESLSLALVKLGDLERALGRRTHQRAAYQEALGIDERLLTLDPTSDRLVSGLALSHGRVGHLWKAERQFALAADHLEQACALQEQLAGRAETHSVWLCDAAQLRFVLASTRLAQGDQKPLARESIRIGLTMAQRAVELGPDNAGSHQALRVLLLAQANLEPLDDRLATRSAALEAARVVRRLTPDDPGSLVAVASTLTAVATARARLGKFREAQREFERALRLVDDAVQQHPRASELRSNQISIRYSFAESARQAGRSELAEQLAEGGVGLAARLGGAPDASEGDVVIAMRALIQPQAGSFRNPELAERLAAQAEQRLDALGPGFHSARAKVRQALAATDRKR